MPVVAVGFVAGKKAPDTQNSFRDAGREKS